jgi:transcriptional regulator with XRE-family HTH domain
MWLFWLGFCELDAGWLTVRHQTDACNMPVVTTRKAPEELDIALGAAIRLRRRTLGISQEMLAEQCGVSFQQIQKYENGANRISFSRLAQIAAALHCRVGDLIAVLGSEDSGPQDRALHVRMALPGALDLLEAYEALSPAVRAAMVGLFRTLAVPT